MACPSIRSRHSRRAHPHPHCLWQFYDRYVRWIFPEPLVRKLLSATYTTVRCRCALVTLFALRIPHYSYENPEINKSPSNEVKGIFSSFNVKWDMIKDMIVPMRDSAIFSHMTDQCCNLARQSRDEREMRTHKQTRVTRGGVLNIVLFNKKDISYFRVSNYKSTLAVIGVSFLYSLFIFALLMSRFDFQILGGRDKQNT